MIAIPRANFARCGRDRACECSHSQVMVRKVIGLLQPRGRSRRLGHDCCVGALSWCGMICFKHERSYSQQRKLHPHRNTAHVCHGRPPPVFAPQTSRVRSLAYNIAQIGKSSLICE